ncbi:MAG: hypothetical protein RCG15_04205 [Candidatus Rickettsia vulgarisii]
MKNYSTFRVHLPNKLGVIKVFNNIKSGTTNYKIQADIIDSAHKFNSFSNGKLFKLKNFIVHNCTLQFFRYPDLFNEIAGVYKPVISWGKK